MTLSRLTSAAALATVCAAALAAPALAQAPAATPDARVADFIDRARAALDARAAAPSDALVELAPASFQTAPTSVQFALLGSAEAGPSPVALTSALALTSDVPSAALPAVTAPAPIAAPVVEAPAAPVVEDVNTPTLQTRIVEEPAVVEDPVQLRRNAAPVRMELLQTRREVVLLPGVGSRETRTAPTAVPTSATVQTESRIISSRATVIVGEAGRRQVVYLSAKPGPLDLGAETGCGTDAVEIGRRLRGTSRTSLRRGMRGDAVRAAQSLLCVAGHPEAGTDGVFGAEMDAAVRDFQRAHNLAVDGALGPNTRRALDAAAQSRFGG